MAQNCNSTQIIDGNGHFMTQDATSFMKTSHLDRCSLSYTVVAIFGPQSSGKSTLLNTLFGTDFRVLDAAVDWTRTTRGVWIANSLLSDSTIVMDLEGSDSGQRLEDGASFERRIALFALATADIVIFNLSNKDISRNDGACRPLFRSLLQEIKRIIGARKILLLVVLRDKVPTPLERLEAIVRHSIQKEWDAIHKPVERESPLLSELFSVEVTALASYQHNPDQFSTEVNRLREQHFRTDPGRAINRQRRLPASEFCSDAMKKWQAIMENKNLDLPSFQVMAETLRCGKLASELLGRFRRDEDWLRLDQDVRASLSSASRFRERLEHIVHKYLEEYDKETIYFDRDVSQNERQQLELRILELAHDAYVTILRHLQAKAIEDFKSRMEKDLKNNMRFNDAFCRCRDSCLLEFDNADAAIRQRDWNASNVREDLDHDMNILASSLKDTELTKIKLRLEKQVRDALCETIAIIIRSGEQGTWTSIEEVVKREVKKAAADLLTIVDGFLLDNEAITLMENNLWECARDVVRKSAREEAGRVIWRMKDRFWKLFNFGDDMTPRVWTGKENIQKLAEEARKASLELLSIMAIVRLDGKSDNIRDTLFLSLIDKKTSTEYDPLNCIEKMTATEYDPLNCISWDKVSLEDTIITPIQCKNHWKQFIDETDLMVSQASLAEKTHKDKVVMEVTTGVLSGLVMAGTTGGAVTLDCLGLPGSPKLLLLGSHLLWLIGQTKDRLSS